MKNCICSAKEDVKNKNKKYIYIFHNQDELEKVQREDVLGYPSRQEAIEYNFTSNQHVSRNFSNWKVAIIQTSPGNGQQTN